MTTPHDAEVSKSLRIAYAMNAMVAFALAIGFALNVSYFVGVPVGALAFLTLNRLAERAFK